MPAQSKFERVLWGLLEASPTEWLGFLAGLVGICVAVWLVVRIGAWYRDDEGLAAANEELLPTIADLHREGSLSDEEFRSIKGRIVHRKDGSRYEQTPEARTTSAGTQQNIPGDTTDDCSAR